MACGFNYKIASIYKIIPIAAIIFVFIVFTGITAEAGVRTNIKNEFSSTASSEARIISNIEIKSNASSTRITENEAGIKTVATTSPVKTEINLKTIINGQVVDDFGLNKPLPASGMELKLESEIKSVDGKATVERRTEINGQTEFEAKNLTLPPNDSDFAETEEAVAGKIDEKADKTAKEASSDTEIKISGNPADNDRQPESAGNQEGAAISKIIREVFNKVVGGLRSFLHFFV